MSVNSTDHQSPSTRRKFLKSSGALAAGMSLVQSSPADAAPKKQEALAVDGGPKAVSAPHNDVSRWPIYSKAAEDAVLKLLREPGYDPIVKLEADWKRTFGAPFVKAHCNGTGALTSMFFALDLPPGSEILVPSYTFFATIVPMRLFDLVPVFVDIDPQTFNFDLDDAKQRLTSRTKAVLPVHWQGLPCEMDQIGNWADSKGLAVLEDCAQAHGATLKDKPVGNWGRMSIFSFQMSKQVAGMEGGMGVYREKDDCDRATAFGNYDQCRGKYQKYRGTGLGTKLRMNPMAAVLARLQLQSLPGRTKAGVAQVRALNDRLTKLSGLSEPKARADMQRVYYPYNVLFLEEKAAGMSRAGCVKALRAEGVDVGAYQSWLQHKFSLYTEKQWWHHPPVIPELPGSEQANRTAIRLPYFTSDQPELIEQYARAFEKVWAHRKKIG